MTSKILLIGGGGHCHAVIDVIESRDEFEIVGIIDSAEKVGQTVSNYPVIGTDSDLCKLAQHIPFACITVGQIKTPDIRMKLFAQAQSAGFQLPAIVSSRAYVSASAVIGSGTVVMHDALINAHAVVGDNCIINTKALIEHDAQIGNHCHISTGSIVNGAAIIRDGSFFGSNAVSVQGAVVSERSFIKAGSLVL